jgi:hypothetical protein
MLECQRCFWLTQHKIWKRPNGIFPSLPSGMDSIIKIHFDRFRERKTLPPEINNDMLDNRTSLFDDKQLLEIWRNNFKGISWTDNEGNILKGAVDDILIKEDKLIVLDYKTKGFALKNNSASFYQNQLDIYNFILRKNGYKTEDYAFLLFYIPKEISKSGEIVFDTNLVKVNTNIKNAELLFLGALALLDCSCPKQTCEWCRSIGQS